MSSYYKDFGFVCKCTQTDSHQFWTTLRPDFGHAWFRHFCIRHSNHLLDKNVWQWTEVSNCLTYSPKSLIKKHGEGLGRKWETYLFRANASDNFRVCLFGTVDLCGKFGSEQNLINNARSWILQPSVEIHWRALLFINIVSQIYSFKSAAELIFF